MKKMNVESFNLDHTKVQAPYIRLADRKEPGKGVVLTKWDIRFCQPNESHLSTPAAHSIEHLFAETSRSFTSDVIDFSPMGCLTGFYLILSGEGWTTEKVFDLVSRTLEATMTADAVPGANETQCGWAENHSLLAAKDAIRQFLEQRPYWGRVTV